MCFHDRITKFISSDLLIISCCLQFLWISSKCFCDVNTRKYHFQLCNNSIEYYQRASVFILATCIFYKTEDYFSTYNYFLGLLLLLELHH